MLFMGKSTISMGHGFHSYVLNYQGVDVAGILRIRG